MSRCQIWKLMTSDIKNWFFCKMWQKPFQFRFLASQCWHLASNVDIWHLKQVLCHMYWTSTLLLKYSIWSSITTQAVFDLLRLRGLIKIVNLKNFVKKILCVNLFFLLNLSFRTCSTTYQKIKKICPLQPCFSGNWGLSGATVIRKKNIFSEFRIFIERLVYS